MAELMLLIILGAFVFGTIGVVGFLIYKLNQPKKKPDTRL